MMFNDYTLLSPQEAAKVHEQDLKYFGIGLIGPKKKINKLTGNMPLLR